MVRSGIPGIAATCIQGTFPPISYAFMTHSVAGQGRPAMFTLEGCEGLRLTQRGQRTGGLHQTDEGRVRPADKSFDTPVAIG